MRLLKLQFADLLQLEIILLQVCTYNTEWVYMACMVQYTYMNLIFGGEKFDIYIGVSYFLLLSNLRYFCPKTDCCKPGEIQTKMPSCYCQDDQTAHTSKAPQHSVFAPKYLKFCQINNWLLCLPVKKVAAIFVEKNNHVITYYIYCIEFSMIEIIRTSR